jgi:Tol biopolymer transport system component
MACSGKSGASTSPTTVTSSPPAATLEPGDVRFLLARRSVIEDITLSGQQAGVVQLDGDVNILDMSLSPDGRQIAFVVELPAYTNDKGELDFGADLYVSDIDGANIRKVAEHAHVGDYFEAPAWLDDTTLIVGWRGADVSLGSFSRIETVNLKDGAGEVVLSDAAMGNLSPDRKSIVYTAINPETRVQRLVIEDLATDDEPRVLVNEYAGLALFSAVSFSPDETQIAFAAVDFLNSPAPPPMPPPPQDETTHVATVTTHPFAQDVWLINTDGTGLRRLGDIAENMPSVTWSGDGSSIYALGPAFLWRIDPATAEPEKLRESGERGAILWLDGG